MNEWIKVGDCQFGEVFYNTATKALRVPVDEEGSIVVAEDWEPLVGEAETMLVGDLGPGTILIEPKKEVREILWNVRGDES